MLRQRAIFVFLVVFFTIFGAGRSHYWDVVAVDQAGWTYAIDLYSVTSVAPQVVSCRVLALHPGGGRVTDRWRIDATNLRLVRRSQGTSEAILPGSVAQQAIIFLRKSGDLPIGPEGAARSRR